MEVMTGLLMFRSSSLFIKGETQKLVDRVQELESGIERPKELTPITWRFIANLSIFHQ